MAVVPYLEHSPEISDDAFIAPDSWITGKVIIGSRSSVFFGAVIRGDIQFVRIGNESNIQDNSVIHTSRGLQDCVIGNRVTVGHAAILHGCTIHDFCIIGMGTTILDGAEIGENCIIGANSLITMNTKIPAGHLALGSPAKAVRKLTDSELQEIQASADSYIKVASNYSAYFKKAAN